MQNEKNFLDSKGRLERWPYKLSDKLLVLSYLVTKFDFETTYTEPEVNKVLKQWHTFYDWPLLRRQLCDRGFMDRDPEGPTYRLHRLTTSLPRLILVGPDAQNDPLTAVKWLDGDIGRETLHLMGNSDKQNKPTTKRAEDIRVRKFITSTTERTWMMRYDGMTVGVIWINLEPTIYLDAPSIHFMIGDVSMRRRGIGRASVTAIIALLKTDGNATELYSRYFTGNTGSKALLERSGFQSDGIPYKQRAGLVFQNVKLTLK
jgi:RimJ/RimL family protein N-acetyltransferase